jgi:tetratricopeptide (TPR) repeat protein
MTGQSKLSMQYIRDMVKDLPADFLKENAPIVESFVALPMEVMVRFGKWDDVLAEPENYPEHMPFTRAFHHAARAVAFAAKGDVEEARAAQSVFAERAQLVPKETAVGNNTAEAILPLVAKMTEGEILVAEGKVDEGLAELRGALAMEDALKYDEPPAWMIPLRHTIGANLMRNGRFAEAEEIYREDLKRLPENGWSLYGLAESLRAQNKDEAKVVKARFAKTWAKADVKINSSCLCRPFISASR